MSARDYFEKDYYAALGVPKEASAADVKKAYRKLARELHPDANPGDAKAEQRFKEVSEAHAVLSDPEKRKEYDEARALLAAGGGRMRGGPGAGGQAGGFGFDLGDLFGQAASRGGSAAGGLGDLFGGLFNGGRGGGAAGTGGRAGSQRGRDVEASVTLGFVDAVRGATVPLRLSTPSSCPTCAGSGAAPGTAPQTCSVCGGAGVVSRNQGGFGFAEPCRNCLGAGTVVPTPCPTCAGSGRTVRDRTLTVRVPAGVADGQRIRLAGKGEPGLRGAPAGDLLVAVRVSPHPVFGRKDDHLTVTVPISFPEAALGANVAVPTLDGEVTLKVPPGTTSGRTFRVKGRGVPRKHGAGDLLVTVEVAVPTDLSPEAKAALEAFADAHPEDPRARLTAAAARS